MSLPPGGEGGPARLYLVEPGSGFPPVSGCLEDWVSLPASDDEIVARAEALMRRWLVHRENRRTDSPPHLDTAGVLHSGDRWVDLPPTEARLMGALLAEFGESVTIEQLLSAGWEAARPGVGALRVHVLRLRRRIAALGLAIHALPGRGYMLTWV
ncbi:MAG TPA: winged helix-turn-helix domain-containing protein [Acidimicrobiales bacterium]|nr:winged helix-turn-helix domain-containing protein [Acidimicrobiales bacterium]